MRSRQPGKIGSTHLLQHLALALVALLRRAHTVPHDNEFAVDVREPGLQGIPERFLDLLFDELGGERSDGLVKDVVVPVVDGELERINLDTDIVDLENGSGIMMHRGKLNYSLSTKINKSITSLPLSEERLRRAHALQ